MEWAVWLGSALLLVATGFWSVWRARRASRHRAETVAVSRARGAIELAEASQNAAVQANRRADSLLAQARSLLAGAPDVETAAHAERLAAEADRSWHSE